MGRIHIDASDYDYVSQEEMIIRMIDMKKTRWFMTGPFGNGWNVRLFHLQPGGGTKRLNKHSFVRVRDQCADASFRNFTRHQLGIVNIAVV